MKPDDFVKAYLPYATQIEKKLEYLQQQFLLKRLLKAVGAAKHPAICFSELKTLMG